MVREVVIASRPVAHPLFYQWQGPEVWHSIARARCTCSMGNAPVITSDQVKPNRNKIDALVSMPCIPQNQRCCATSSHHSSLHLRRFFKRVLKFGSDKGYG